MENLNNNGNKRKNRRMIPESLKEKYSVPYIPKNLFGEDLTSDEGKRRYNTKYMKFYRMVYNEEKDLRKNLGANHKDVKLDDKKLADLLKKVAFLSLIAFGFYSGAFYTIVLLFLL